MPVPMSVVCNAVIGLGKNAGLQNKILDMGLYFDVCMTVVYCTRERESKGVDTVFYISVLTVGETWTRVRWRYQLLKNVLIVS